MFVTKTKLIFAVYKKPSQFLASSNMNQIGF